VSPTADLTPAVGHLSKRAAAAETQIVLDRLDRVWAAMFRDLIAAAGPTRGTVAYLQALYAEPARSSVEVDIGRLTAARALPAALPFDPTTRVLSAERGDGCIAVVAQRNYVALPKLRPFLEPKVVRLDLRPAQPGRDSTGLNRTGWVIAGEQLLRGPTDGEEGMCGAPPS